MRASPILLVLAACGGHLTPQQQQDACARMPADVQRVEWRELQVPLGCAREIPAQPITGEAAFAAALPCLQGQPRGVDWANERVLAMQLPGAASIAWIGTRAGSATMRTVVPAQCGGMQPATEVHWVVLPLGVPVPYGDACSYGDCPPGPPRA